MGRIKTLMIKNAADELFRTGDGFSESFERNKKVLGNNTMPSKSVRNKIAGGIANLAKKKRQKENDRKSVKEQREEEY